MKAVTYEEIDMNFIESLTFDITATRNDVGEVEYIPSIGGSSFVALKEIPKRIIVEGQEFIRVTTEYAGGSGEHSIEPRIIVTYQREW